MASWFDRPTVTPVRVIANIGWVRASYPGGRSYTFTGGAGLHLSLAISAANGLAIPVATIGGDLSALLPALRRRHVGTHAIKVVPNRRSGRFELSYDEAGHLVSAASQFHAADELSQYALTQLDASSHFHVSCRRPLDIGPLLSALVGKSFSLDFYSPSIATYLDSVRSFLPLATTIFVNQTELALLQQAVRIADLEVLVVSNGARFVRLFSRGEMIATARPPAVSALEVTGAGDTLTGTYLASTLAGASVQEAVHAAVKAASAATQSVDDLLEEPRRVR